MNEIKVSPVEGEHVMLVNGFEIRIEIVFLKDEQAIRYFVYRKGLHINTYVTLQRAVAWCSD